MREIKFRAYTYRPERGWFMVYSDDNLVGFFREYVYEDIDQFTGMKDKGSVDIYECDVVRCNESEELVYRVEFIDGMYITGDGCPLADWHEVEVIGNIYETPDLLKERS